MLSQTTEYALRASVYLARHQGAGYVGVKEVAEGTGVPSNYLAKILQQLTRSKVLCSQKGFGGGFRIAEPVNKVRLLQIVSAVEDTARLTRCILGHEHCKDHGECPLTFSKLSKEYMHCLRTTTLYDVIFPKKAAPDALTANVA